MKALSHKSWEEFKLSLKECWDLRWGVVYRTIISLTNYGIPALIIWICMLYFYKWIMR